MDVVSVLVAIGKIKNMTGTGTYFTGTLNIYTLHSLIKNINKFSNNICENRLQQKCIGFSLNFFFFLTKKQKIN